MVVKKTNFQEDTDVGVITFFTVNLHMRDVFVKNKSSNSYGILVDLDDFVKFIKELKSTDALSSLKEKYPKGSIEYALVSQINNVSSE